ncbi:hypothetical protein FBU30_003811 [Linnemannia zychae]|nr:hypothetical protein FBU30_003811 [Linnemannia zychae]
MTACLKISFLTIPVAPHRPSYLHIARLFSHSSFSRSFSSLPLSSLCRSQSQQSIESVHTQRYCIRYISTSWTIFTEPILTIPTVTTGPTLSSLPLIKELTKGTLKAKPKSTTKSRITRPPSTKPSLFVQLSVPQTQPLPAAIETSTHPRVYPAATRSRDTTPIPDFKVSKVKNRIFSKGAPSAPSSTHERSSPTSAVGSGHPKQLLKRNNKLPRTHNTKQSQFHPKANTSVPRGFDDGTQMGPNETLSEQVKILCEAFAEANIRCVRQYPPVYMISTYEQAELAMQIFTEYYKLTDEGLQHVGFDTETECHWGESRAQQDQVSIIQVASQDVCLIFQIHRIVKSNSTSNEQSIFPRRLKALLEDPTIHKLGVGAKRDGNDLDRVFNLNCKGIINLETVALEKNILERSLQDLDERYGRPGREVYKTKALLGWKWNAEELQPHWIWYAAKDAFAGIAIYENMLANRVKDTYKPYEERFPMTENELKKDAMTFLERAMGGKGRQTSLGAVETTLNKGYSRFQKMYQPEERIDVVKNLVQHLIADGRLTRHVSEPQSPIHKDDVITITGERLERVLKTKEAIDVLRPYFNNTGLSLLDISTKGITLPNLLFDAPDQLVDEDFEDFRLFIELGSMWQQPRKLNGMTSLFLIELETAGYKDLPPLANTQPGTKLPEKKFISFNVERAKANNIGVKWRAFLGRLVRRRVLSIEGGMYSMSESLEERCREAAPAMASEFEEISETKRQKALHKAAAAEARLSTVRDLMTEEKLGPGAQKRIRFIPNGEEQGENPPSRIPATDS